MTFSPLDKKWAWSTFDRAPRTIRWGSEFNDSSRRVKTCILFLHIEEDAFVQFSSGGGRLGIEGEGIRDLVPSSSVTTAPAKPVLPAAALEGDEHEDIDMQDFAPRDRLFSRDYWNSRAGGRAGMDDGREVLYCIVT